MLSSVVHRLVFFVRREAQATEDWKEQPNCRTRCESPTICILRTRGAFWEPRVARPLGKPISHIQQGHADGKQGAKRGWRQRSSAVRFVSHRDLLLYFLSHTFNFSNFSWNFRQKVSPLVVNSSFGKIFSHFRTQFSWNFPILFIAQT